MRKLPVINYLFRLVKYFLRPFVLDIVIRDIRIFGDKNRLRISNKACMTNTLFNTYSGNISIDDYTFSGHNVSIITGTHDYDSKNIERINGVPMEGRDITIGKGVWLGSNCTIIGPCTIGDNAVIGACSLVLKDVPANTIVAGVPAKIVKKI